MGSSEQYTLTITANPAGGGTTTPPVGSYEYEEGDFVTLRAIPSQGYRFVNWSGGVAYLTVDTVTVTISGDKSIVANFEAVQHNHYILTITVSPTNGGTTTPPVGSYEYDEGAKLTLYAIPAQGYQFMNWYDDTEYTTTDTVSVTMDGDRSILARFEEKILPSMVTIPGGTFQMGNILGGDSDERPVHSVTVSSFAMSAKEITQGQYQLVMGRNPPSTIGPYGVGSLYPVYAVTWIEAAWYCNRLSDEAGFDRCYDQDSWECDFSKNGFRLPTEAEWEYAYRGGTSTTYYWGDNNVEWVAKDYCWYELNAYSGHWTTPHATQSGSQPVGTKLPNSYGLFDMSGNVWEWCNDWYGEGYYTSSPTINPTGPDIGSNRVMRGGSWNDSVLNCDSADRSWYDPYNSRYFLGFRVVRRP